MTEPSKLSLYQTPMCGYCMRVRRALDRLGVEIEIRDLLREPRFRQELIEATGRATVPVLRIEEEDGQVRWMPESLDIIAYLEEHFSS